MSELRNIHNPGSLVPIPITADAIRYIINGLMEAERQERKLAEWVISPASGYAEGMAQRLRQKCLFAADRYQGLIRELKAAKEQTSAGPMAGMLSEDVAVVGRDLYKVAADHIAAEKAGLSVPARR